MANKYPVEIDGKTGDVETLPPTKNKRYRCKLDTMADIKAEMSKVYREARSGVVDVQDATKLTWMLQAVGKVIESEEPEKAAGSQPMTLDEFYGGKLSTDPIQAAKDYQRLMG